MNIGEDELIGFLNWAVTDKDCTHDFGYLLIPDDAQLNGEAMYLIRKKFKEYCELQQTA